jgi:hypothetical protein
VGKPACDRAAPYLLEPELVLAALATLPGDGARAGVEALIELTGRYRLLRADELLSTWAQRRGLGS